MYNFVDFLYFKFIYGVVDINYKDYFFWKDLKVVWGEIMDEIIILN